MYYDRLIDDSDRHWLFELIQKMVKAHFKDDFQSIFKHLAAGSKVTDDDLRSLMFGDYMKPDAVSGDSILHTSCVEELSSMQGQSLCSLEHAWCTEVSSFQLHFSM